MGAFFLIAGALAFLAAAVFLRLRTAWLCLPLFIALCWFLPSGFIIHSFPPPQDPATEIVYAHRPMPDFFAFTFMFLCMVLAIIWRTVALASITLGNKQPRRWSHRFLQGILCLFSAGVFCIFALIFTSITNKYLLNVGGTDGTVFPRAGYWFYFLCTSLICTVLAVYIRRKKYVLSVAIAPATLVLAITAGGAIASHTDILRRAESLADGKPYCMTLGNSHKAPHPFAFAEIFDIVSLMQSSWPRGEITKVFQGGSLDYTETSLTPQGLHVIPPAAIRVMPCKPEAHYALLPWPRPPLETFEVHAPQAIYKIPAAAARIEYRSVNHSVQDPDVSIALETETHFVKITAHDIRADKPASDTPQFKELYADRDSMTFHHAPFGYEVLIKKSDRANAAAIQQQLIEQVESWRVDDTAALPE